MVDTTLLDRPPLAPRLVPEPPIWLTESNLREFFDIYRRKRLSAVFQPILDFKGGGYLGYEGLIRGPADSPLHNPGTLFGLARQTDLTMEFERVCREVVLREFARLQLPGKLFINVSAGCLADPTLFGEEMTRLLDSLKLTANRIVIEITENQQVEDFAALQGDLTEYRRRGFSIAIDDLGEGFSNLRMWTEVRPEYVKIDRHFISGIADDPLKLQFVKSMNQIGEISHAHLIAEGIETEAEFTTIRDLGICFGQGFLIERPSEHPSQELRGPVASLLIQRTIIVYPSAGARGGATARQLLQEITPVSPSSLNEEVFNRFEDDPVLMVLPVVGRQGEPLGLINRYFLIDRFARPYRRELYGKRPCTLFMDPGPLVVDESTPVQEIGRLVAEAPQHRLLDGFVITAQGRYRGIGSSQSLMALITDLQISAARYANPLTQLPGNVPINEHIDRLLEAHATFAACYCDLDHFKPFNDCFGYREGDQIIQTLGDVLEEACDPRLDFVGHIGGDDFMMLLQSPDWQTRLAQLLERLDERLLPLLPEEARQRGGYYGEDRRNQWQFHPLPSLSIGCLVVEPFAYHSHHEVSAAVVEAKKQAKKTRGNSLFIERRRVTGVPLTH